MEKYSKEFYTLTAPLGPTATESKADKKKAEGNEHFRNGRYYDAINCYDSAISLGGSKSVCFANMAMGFLKVEQFKMAANAASKAFEYDPKNVKARYRRAVARKEMMNYKAAVIDLETILRHAPCDEARNELRKVRELRSNAKIWFEATDGTVSDDDWPHYDHDPLWSNDEGSFDEEYYFDGDYSEVDYSDEEDGEGCSGEESADYSREDYSDEEYSDSDYSGEGFSYPSHYEESCSEDDSSNEGGGMPGDWRDYIHTGNEIPCQFYNHDGCNRGTDCAYSHAPDRKSVRDRLGKNVCLFYLFGGCRYGADKCVYSHSREQLSKHWSQDAMRPLIEIATRDYGIRPKLDNMIRALDMDTQVVDYIVGSSLEGKKVHNDRNAQGDAPGDTGPHPKKWKESSLDDSAET
ncbi:hypothetical protein HGRIS_008397 [Hohenbuehelia grisea]|uniref:C3H1-type domain-containing protein n=1 Tax=Hohenbuehelia grisea TaxID=104357 RepID=A0ABR3J7U0_9AGAR